MLPNGLAIDSSSTVFHNDSDILQEPLNQLQSICIGYYSGGPLDRVKTLVSRQHDGDFQLFVELLRLEQPRDDIWKEAARWITFKETVEEDGRRWSKPHVPAVTVPALLQFRTCLRRGTVFLDHEATNFPVIIEDILRDWVRNGIAIESALPMLRATLLANKKHLMHQHRAEQLGLQVTGAILRSVSRERLDSEDRRTLRRSVSTAELSTRLSRKNSSASLTRQLSQKSKPVRTGIVKSMTQASVLKLKLHMLKKLQEGAEGVAVFCGKLEGIKKTGVALVRLRDATFFDGLLEVNIPTRLLFFVVAPQSSKMLSDASAVAGAAGALLTDRVYMEVIYTARELGDLCNGVDEFIKHATVLPPGKWHPDDQLDPPDHLINTESRKSDTAALPNGDMVEFQQRLSLLQAQESSTEGLVRTGRLFGGLIEDVRRKLPWLKSDFQDTLDMCSVPQILATSLFLFFASLTNLVTFGVIISHQEHEEMAVMEMLVSGLVSGVLFAIFSGQPLNIPSATAPVLAFDVILFKLCYSQGWGFFAARFWVGMWTGAILLVAVAMDMSALVALVTRFTEECFATLIGLNIVIQAIEEVMSLSEDAPLTRNPAKLLESPCNCTFTNGTSIFVNPEHDVLNQCVNGTLTGDQCTFHPDIFMFSLLLFIGTFAFIIFFKDTIKHSRFFTTNMRRVISSFSIVLSIGLMTVLSRIVGLQVPHMSIPDNMEPTFAERTSWYVDPMHGIPLWLCAAAVIPALLFSILLFLEQQTPAVIVNSPDNKLRKGYGYHLDLLVLAVVVVVCSVMGIPYFSAAAILSMTHVESLRLESTNVAPGERPQFLGIREQRVTALIAALLLGLSLLIKPVLSLVPIPILFGVLLYMGYASLHGQFVDRILLFGMPRKSQPDFSFLRLVRLPRVHMFTIVQLVCLGVLLVFKEIKAISIGFPLMLMAVLLVRSRLEVWLTPKELHALDDPMPTWRTLNRRLGKRHDGSPHPDDSEASSPPCATPPADTQSRITAPSSSAAVATPSFVTNQQRASTPSILISSYDDHDPAMNDCSISDVISRYSTQSGTRPAAPTYLSEPAILGGRLTPAIVLSVDETADDDDTTDGVPFEPIDASLPKMVGSLKQVSPAPSPRSKQRSGTTSSTSISDTVGRDTLDHYYIDSASHNVVPDEAAVTSSRELIESTEKLDPGSAKEHLENLYESASDSETSDSGDKRCTKRALSTTPPGNGHPKIVFTLNGDCDNVDQLTEGTGH